MYIIIIEDDQFFFCDLKVALLILYPDAREADSVRAAMIMLAGGPPYLAVLDYNLETGTSAVIAARLARENVPFCYVTADSEGVRADSKIPDCPIVTKPYRIEDVRRVAAALLKPRARGSRFIDASFTILR